MDSARDPAERPGAAPEGRRFLLATAVTDVAAHPEARRPELADDVHRMERLFLGELGFRKGADLPLDPSREQLAKSLRAFATAPERRPDDYVVLYFAAHGITAEHSGRHYLLTADSDARDPAGTALRTEDLVGGLWEDTAIERLLVLLDACYSEEGTDKALRAALEARHFREPVTDHGSTGLVLVASSRRKEETYTGVLPAAFDRAVRRRATAGHAPAHISLEHVMAAIAGDPEVPPAQRPVWSLTHATAGIPAFLPNPRHLPEADGLKLEEIDTIVALGSRERLARERELTGFFLPRARGTDLPTEEVWDFTGRHRALADLTAWLAPQREAERLCVVTGDPGSGKSSLLGMVAVLTDPDRAAAVPRAGLPRTLPEPGDVDVPVNASHKSTRQLLDALAAAAGCAAESLGALTAQLQTRTEPLVVLIDSLDEALAPQEAVEELLTPLTDPERRLPLRLLIGARPHVAGRLSAAARRVNLDDDRYGDPDAVRAYVRKLLTVPGSVLAPADPRLVDAIAGAVAEAAGRSFLVARITARTIARDTRVPDPHDQRWRDELPRLPGEAMERDLDQRLGPLAGRARDLLLPLAFAQGAGLPWAGVWPRLASVLSGRDYGDEDVVWLRQAAGSYVVESVEDEGSVYRVYHRALIEYLREGHEAAHVQRAVTRVLRELDHPYVRRYLALHAGEGGVLDPLVQSARFVLTSDPGQLLAALPRLRTADGRRAGQALRDLEGMLRARGGCGADPEGRARLRLAAVCRKARALADSCDVGHGPGQEALPWRARWAAWNPHEGSRRYEGLACRVGWGVVVPRPPGEGAEYLEMAPWRGGQALWDLETGLWTDVTELLGEELWGQTWTAPPQLPSCAALLSPDQRREPRNRWLGWSEHVRLLRFWLPGARTTSIWMLPPAEGLDFEPDRRPVQGPEQVLVLAGDRGEPAAAVLRFRGGVVLVYKLGSERVYQPLTRAQRRALSDVAIEEWQDLAEQRAAQLTGVFGPVQGTSAALPVTACAAPLGLPAGSLLFGYGDGTVGQSDSGTGTATGHEGPVTLIDLVAGHPQGRLLVTAGEDGTVRLTSLTAREPVRTLLADAGEVAALAVRRVGRQWIVAVATTRGQLHRIDLDSGRPIGLPLRVGGGKAVRLAVFELGVVSCVSVQGDARGLQLYDLVTGDRVGGQDQRHEANAVQAVNGTVCVGGSDGVVRFWPTAQVADSVQLNAHDGAVLALGEIHGPPGAPPALVSVGRDGELRCWEVARPHELWRRRIMDQGVWTSARIACATVGHTVGGRDVVATGEHGGRVRVLTLRGGLPVAEREFTLPEPVTALTTGRVGDRDVVVAATALGRLSCWDVAGDRMYAQGPAPDVPQWTTALALAPDGSGRLVAGGDDGTLREWSLPGCHPLGGPRRAHRGQVCALALVAAPGGPRLVSSGTDHRLVSHRDGWERRMPMPVVSFGPEPGPEPAPGEGPRRAGLLCGDYDGQVWRLRATQDRSGGGWVLAEAFDVARPVSALATVETRGRTAVVAGGEGALMVRDAEFGDLTRRLRPRCGSGVRELRTVNWRSPDRAPRPLLFARSRWGLLEYWDFGPGAALRSAGTPLITPVPHSGSATARLAVLEEEGGAQSLLSLDVWNAAPIKTLWNSGERRWDDVRELRLAVHDVADGPLLDQPLAPAVGDREFGAFRAVRCGGRLFVFVREPEQPVRVLDAATGRWTRLDARHLLDVFALDGTGGPELLLIDRDFVATVPLAALLRDFGRPGGRSTRHRALWVRRLLRRPERAVGLTRLRGYALRNAAFACVLPGKEAFAVAGGTSLAVVGFRDARFRYQLELPSRCTALAAGPHGELAVGTRNGVILFD
ncbi:caspase family protein [Actinomycetota bacterium Odt1-20B]